MTQVSSGLFHRILINFNFCAETLIITRQFRTLEAFLTNSKSLFLICGKRVGKSIFKFPQNHKNCQFHHFAAVSSIKTMFFFTEIKEKIENNHLFRTL